MREDLMELLCCPVCRGDLTLEAGRKEGAEILDGKIHCASCSIDYPIEDGIPNLLPPEDRD
ncbi:MAG: methytransferase partner Trm112 [Thermoplasmata archaeon]|nr:methytransferase partner Trm112 [Thermoplasmata archaeon]